MRPSVHNGVGAKTPPLSSIFSTAPTAAFSLRKLIQSYSGPVIRVRRDSDNAESDIGFNNLSELDIGALRSFVGNTANGFVVTWYDQSSIASHATQTTTSLQPRIISAGVIDTSNGKPTILFSGAQWLITNTSQYVGATGYWSSSVVFATSQVASQAVVDADDGVSVRLAQFMRVATLNAVSGVAFNSIGNSITANSGSTVANQLRVGSIVRAEQATAYAEGIAGTVTTSQTGLRNITSPLYIGRRGNSANFLSGNVSEVLIFPSVLSVNERQTIERNQGVYYNVVVS